MKRLRNIKQLRYHPSKWHYYVFADLANEGVRVHFSLWRHLHHVHHFKATTASTFTWFLLWKARRAVVPFIINIMRDLCSKSLLKGSLLSCTSLAEVVSSPQYGYRYLNKMKEIYIFSTVWVPIFDGRLVLFIHSIL